MVDILPEDAPAPRLCHLIKWPDFDGYGFNLHAERSNPGQFIGKIDDESPAQLAGLREGDRIIEVNGVNINNENHRQVVERIKANPNETKLLVVDPEADQWYREADLVIKSSQLNVTYIRTPVPRPEPDSPRAQFHSSSSSSSQNFTPNSNSAAASGDQVSAAQRAPETSGQQQQQQQQQNSLETSNTQSLETSDFNEDSIEQQQQASKTRQERVSPPMSPDSGRGDEELGAHTKAQTATKTPVAQDGLTVEAEINHQSLEQHARKQQVLAEVKRQFAKRNGGHLAAGGEEQQSGEERDESGKGKTTLVNSSTIMDEKVS